MRTSTIRRIATCIVLAFVATGFAMAAGASESEAASDEQIRLTISIGSHGRFLVEETISEFEEEYPNIDVEIVAVSSVPNEAFQTYSTMFSARDDSLDIIGIDPSWPFHMARAGWITPLEDLMSDEDRADLEDFNEEVLGTNIIQGEVVGIPLYSDALMLYYRADLLEKYGFDPPTSWQELRQQAEVILDGENDPNLSGYIYQAAQIEGLTCNFVNFLSGSGGDILTADGEVVVDSPEALEALTFMVDLVEDGISPRSIVTHNPNDDRIQFENGQAVFMNNWPFAMNSYLNPESPIHGKVGITRMVGHTNDGAATLGATSIAINNYSKNKQAAWTFVKYLTSYEWNLERAVRAGLLPARESVWDDPRLAEENPGLLEMRSGAQYLIARPTTQSPHYLRISESVQRNVSQALLGEVTPDAALAAMSRDISTILQ